MAWTPPDGALHVLDRVSDLRQVEALSLERFSSLTREALLDGEVDTLAEIGGRLDGLRGMLDAAEAYSRRALGIRLMHALADTAVPAPFRKYLATEGTTYAGNLALLRERVQAGVERVEPRRAGEIADAVAAAVEQAIAQKDAIVRALLAIAAEAAVAWLPVARKETHSPVHSDADRRAWRFLVADLKAMADQPARLLDGACAERWAKMPEPEEEPAPEPEPPSRYTLLEVD